MLRILCVSIVVIFSSYSWAGIEECNDTKTKEVDKASGDLTQYQLDDNARSQTGAASGSSPMVKGGNAVQSGTAANAAQLQKLISNNDDAKAHCKKMCDPKNTNTPNTPQTKAKYDAEVKAINDTGKECKDKIDKMQKEEQQALAANQTANPQAADTAKKGSGDPSSDPAKSDSPSKSASSGGMPPISIPPMPPSDSKKPDPTTPQTTDNSTPAQPAAPPATQAPTQTADTGKADFKTASKPSAAAVAQACAGRNASEISGGCTEQTTQVASNATTPFASAAAGGGGSSGGGSSGGISAASVAGLAGGLSKGESEKDGKNSGLKAASMNMAVDGGGGGGGSSGGNALGDLDFGFKPNALRNPASTAVKKASDMAVPGQPQVAQERFSVVRIVTDVYSDKCKAGKFLHCGNNK